LKRIKVGRSDYGRHEKALDWPYSVRRCLFLSLHPAMLMLDGQRDFKVMTAFSSVSETAEIRMSGVIN
jgi:hypothetical protein